jgi:hypothetical protein
MNKLKKYKNGSSKQNELTVYIICGNRQMVQRQVKATKKFLYNKDTYVIKPSCIFLKIIDGKLKSISIYREGNPNPYDFKILKGIFKHNTGLKEDELNDLYGEDLYNMLVKVQTPNKMFYMLIIETLVLALTICCFFKIWFLGM